jgi:hypothetical protein
MITKKEISPIVVRKNVSGHGWDTENSATFGTRHKFPDYNNVQKSMPAEEIEMLLIENLDGVTGISTYPSIGDPYSLHVKKGLAFSWAELEPKILTLLEQRAKRITE